MNNYGKIKTIKCKGTSGDLVTNADIECENIVIEYLVQNTLQELQELLLS